MLVHLRFYLLTLISLFAVSFGEKVLFAFFQTPLGEGLSTLELATTLAWGIRFDLASAAALTLLSGTIAYLLFRLLGVPFARASEYTAFAAGTALIFIHGADLLYFAEAGRHLGYELKEGLNSGASLAGTAIGTYTGAVLTQFGLIAVFFLLNRLWFRRLGGAAALPADWRRFILPETQWFLALLASVVLVRGGLQSVPLEPLHAQAIGDTNRAALTLNGAYNALFSSITPYTVRPVMDTGLSAADYRRIRALYPVNSAAVTPPSAPVPLNVVVVLLESWSAEYMSAYGFDRSTTPNFKELRTKGLTTRGMLADGLRTTEGMFAIFCSAQNPLGKTVAQTQLQNYDYDCLPELLSRRGYSSAFFQGTYRNTSGTGAFAQLLGFAESYGKEEMPPPELEPNSWGQHDPDVYRFALQRMLTLDQPFIVGINTNSTHDGHMPPGVRPAFTDDDRNASYLNTLHFADQALGDFIRAVESTPELRNTFFVLLADHTGLKPRSLVSKHAIPFLIYSPDHIEPRFIDRIASQRDVTPTLLEILGLTGPDWFTGKSLLRTDQGPYFADFYHGGHLGWIEDGRLTVSPAREPGKTRCYNTVDGEKERPCDSAGFEQQKRGLSFTRIFQHLLFSGEVRSFSGIRSGVGSMGNP